MKTRYDKDGRGAANYGWLDARHSFSFGDWIDPERMGFRSLRVLNDDRIAPGGGFPRHPHRDMEIITYVLDGTIAHEDSMGNREELRAGELQRMSAGTGITHSEFNASKTEPLHLLQIWLHPERTGIEPSYEQKPFDIANKGLVLAASRDAREGSLKIHQDAELYLIQGGQAEHDLGPERHAYVHVATGAATVNGEALEAGDALALSDEPNVTIDAGDDARVLLFDLG
ncbi:MAG: pirin family protein [Planctomycetota bacterium]|jgi:redox-sensitive bicupin YhaK (pirin superfamily)